MSAEDDDRVAFPRARVRAEKKSDALHGALATSLLALTAAGYFFGGFVGALVWLGAVVAPALGLLAWQRSRIPSGGARIEASREGLFSCDKLLVPRSDMIRAVVVPSEGRAVVSVQRKQGFFVAIEVPDEAEGHALVAALGLGAEQRTAEFLVDSPLAARLPLWVLGGTLGLSLAGAVAGLAAGLAGTVLLFLPWSFFFLAWSRPSTITIGTDGVLLSWLGRRTVVPYSQLATIAREGDALRFVLGDGRALRVRAAWTASQRSRSQPEMQSAEVYLDALVERIRLAKEASGGADIAVLDRRGKPLRDWIAHLRALTLREAAGFRDAPASAEALWKTVENGHADPASRAAAAVALGPTLDDPGRTRLRVAAGVVVAPKLRVALSAAADGDEEALSQALAELDPAPRAARMSQ